MTPEMPQKGHFDSVNDILTLYRKWGRERGLEEVKALIAKEPDEKRKVQLHLVIAWISGERGDYNEAEQQLEGLDFHPAAKAWADICHAFILIRQGKLEEAKKKYHSANWLVKDHNLDDDCLKGTIAHCWGTLRYHESSHYHDEAIDKLYEALEFLGSSHFGTGRVLDTIGMYFANRHAYGLALEFYEWALELKQKFSDQLGIALSHGQIGRLHLEWGHLDLAEQHFQKNLEISERNDEHGVAQMYNDLGRVEMARKNYSSALAYLNKSLRLQEGKIGWERREAFARKDRCLAWIASTPRRIPEALEDATRAQELFEAIRMPLGIAFAKVGFGLIYRAEQKWKEAEAAFKQAASLFQEEQIPVEAARALLEMARTQYLANEDPTFVRNTLLRALDQAERSRLDPLVEEVEEELGKVIGAEYWKRFYQRSRGRGIPATMSQVESQGEEATMLFLDIQNYSGFVLSQDPRVVMGTLNQIFWNLSDVLQKHQVIVNQHLGDGFMAFARGDGHESRAVTAGLELLRVVEQEFNRPRKILNKPQLQIRIGIATGFVIFGNVGTYYKMDYTAVGETTNLAARLQSECEQGTVCIAARTYERVKNEFRFKDTEGRLVKPKNFPDQAVWDVTGLMSFQ